MKKPRKNKNLRRLLWRAAGFMFKTAGLVLNRSDVFFLGHYLLGSGKRLPFPSKHEDILQPVLETMASLPDGTYIVASASGGLYLEVVSLNPEVVEYVPVQRDAVELHNTLGKFRVRKSGRLYKVYDRYVWYATCPQQSIHFHRDPLCRCTDKTYPSLHRSWYGEVRLSFARLLPRRWRSFTRKVTVAPLRDCWCEVVFTLVGGTLSVEAHLLISDRFWARKGRAFEVVSHYMLE